MLAKIKRNFDKVRKVGLAQAFKKLFREKIYSVDHVLILTRALDEEFPIKRLTLKSVDLTTATTLEECAPLIAAFPDRAVYFKDYLSQGCTAMFATRNGEVGAYVWITTEDFYDKHFYRWQFTLDPDQIYQFAGFVVPTSRGSTLSVMMLNYVNDFFHETGFKKTLAAVSVSNAASIRLHEKLQFRATGEAFDFYTLLGLRWSRAAKPQEVVNRFQRA